MNLSVFSFESREVRTVTSDTGEVLFVGKDVAAALGYADHTNAMKQHCRGVVKHHPILDSLGRTQEARVLNEADVLRLIVNSKLPAAEAFERWVFEEVLPSIRKTGSYTAPSTPTAPVLTQAEQDVRLAILLADALNVAPSGRITMLGVALKHSAPHMLPALPSYAIDAPPSVLVSGNGSSMVTASATELLKKHGVKMSTAKFNDLLADAGMLNRCQRTSSRGAFKHFWAVTAHGERYGKNITSQKNARETQPHWFVDCFGDLLEVVGVSA